MGDRADAAVKPQDAAPPGGFKRQLPALEPETTPFWTGGAEGRLLICRCKACGHYSHPPLPICPLCHDEVAPHAVSGKGKVKTFSVNYQPWKAGMPVPFVYAAVELAEQPELYVFSNIVGCPVDEVRSGLPVEVVFEQHEDVFLPLFQPVGGAHGA
jgi:uncharacterized OB-fold protein